MEVYLWLVYTLAFIRAITLFMEYRQVVPSQAIL
jgi:hypothetical protein